MAYSNWIMPRAESACGRVFLPSRKLAEEHKVALQLWIAATKHTPADYGLVTYRCARCGGFHVGRKRTETRKVSLSASHQSDASGLAG